MSLHTKCIKAIIMLSSNCSKCATLLDHIPAQLIREVITLISPSRPQYNYESYGNPSFSQSVHGTRSCTLHYKLVLSKSTYSLGLKDNNYIDCVLICSS